MKLLKLSLFSMMTLIGLSGCTKCSPDRPADAPAPQVSEAPAMAPQGAPGEEAPPAMDDDSEHSEGKPSGS